MEEEPAMLRQLISHSLHLSQFYGTHSSTSTPSLPYPQSLYLSWCVLGLDENPIEENCNNNVIITPGKPKKLKMLDPCTKPPPSKRPRKDHDRTRKNNVCPTNSSEEVMDREIWKDLPEDLLEAIVARLPVSAFFRLRSVCRSWNSLPASPSFSEHCLRAPQPRPWFYTITHEHANTAAAIYDPSTSTWRHPPPAAAGLPPKAILLPVASAGGLVCFLDIGHRHFYVCNPLTNSWKELPARSFAKAWSRVAVGMTAESARCGYRVMWVGRDGEHEIYDSVEDSWSGLRSMPPGTLRTPLSLNFRSQSVSVGGTVYFLRSDPEGVVSCETENRVWREDVIPAPPNTRDHCLAEWGGRVYMVGLLTRNAATCVCVWELQRMMLLWREVDRMPNVWCLEFYGKQHVRMTCLGNRGGLLMMSLRSRQMNRIVTYDVSTREWLKVPACVLPRQGRSGGRKRQWIACGAAFYPCLTWAP